MKRLKLVNCWKREKGPCYGTKGKEDRSVSRGWSCVGDCTCRKIQSRYRRLQLYHVPMGALGYTLQTPEEEKYLKTKEELEARLVTYMAGRAAEEIVFHSVTTGAVKRY